MGLRALDSGAVSTVMYLDMSGVDGVNLGPKGAGHPPPYVACAISHKIWPKQEVFGKRADSGGCRHWIRGPSTWSTSPTIPPEAINMTFLRIFSLATAAAVVRLQLWGFIGIVYEKGCMQKMVDTNIRNTCIA